MPDHLQEMDASPTNKMAPQTCPPSTAAPLPKSPVSPCSPSKTAELWDEYEKLALEKAKERSESAPQGKEHSTSRPSFDFMFRRVHAATTSPTVSTCKTCQHPIMYASGVCERCIKTIVVPLGNGETTPPHSPAGDHAVLPESTGFAHIAPREEVITPTFASPKRPSFCPLPSHLTDGSTRLSPAQAPAVMGRRKKSPSEPSQPSLALQITPQPYTARPPMGSPPMTPTSPRYTTQSICSTRRSSLANVTIVPKPSYLHVRNDSGTPSEFSTLYQTVSTATTPPASLHRFGYPLQNATSVWDDWDTDEEDDDAGVGTTAAAADADAADADTDRAGIASWMGRRMRTRDRAKQSLEQTCEGAGDDARDRPAGGVAVAALVARKSRDEVARGEGAAGMRAERSGGAAQSIDRVKKPSGFFRVLSCGCGAE